MNAKLWVCVIMGVLVVHLCVIMIVDNVRTQKLPQPKLVEPNFSASTTTYTNPDGKVLKMEHEFTVETTFAKPEVLGKLPSPPSSQAAESAKPPLPATAN
ncbi:MAG: hypothetical protein ABIP20_02335 [Chthoniobacteraceae bacterium]